VHQDFTRYKVVVFPHGSMNWYYTQHGKQAGPVDDAAICELIQSGAVTRSTMVWSDGMADWLPAGQTQLSSRFAAGGPPPLRTPTPAPTPPEHDWDRDATKIYPSNPPKSPHLSWLNVIVVGLAQILFGQVAKGLAILGAAFVLGIITGGITFFLVAPIAIIDGFMVGNVLKAGQPVGKWEFFPSKR